MNLFCRFLISVFPAFCLTVMQAQDNTGGFISTTSERNTSTNYYYARPNDITFIVNIMGFVQRPGRYEIASSIDIMNLIALAGGPTADGSLSNVRIIRIIKDGEKTIRQDVQPDQKTLSSFLKEEAKITRQEIRLNLENLATARPEDLQLIPGDIIYIDRTTWSAVRDVLTVVVSTTILTYTIVQIIDVSNR